MEVKPGYKQTEVGVIPDDWNPDYIENFAVITTGSKNTQDRVEDAQYPFFVRSQTVERINSYSFDGEAVLTAGDGVGTGKVFHYINGRFDVHQRVYRISNFAQRVNGYFFYLSFSTHFYTRIMQMTAKSSVDSVRRDMISRMQVALPPTEAEQRAIAAALSDVDALLGGLDRLIAKKRDLKQAAMQQLLTGQTRLPGFSGEWVKTRISEMCEYVDGVGTAGGDVGYVEIGDIDVELKAYSLAQKEKLSVPGAVRVPAGTLLISTVRPTRGAIAVTQSSLHVSSAFCRLRPANDLLFHVVCQPTFFAYLGENSIGGTYPTCRDETILDYETALPGDPREQTAIAAVLSDMDAELAALEARRDKTRDLKQAMMQELLTGRTRLL